MEFSERNKILLSIFTHEDKNNIAFFDHYTVSLTNLIVTITEKLAAEKIPLKRHEDYYEIHYFKFVLQILSMKHLFEGTPLHSIKPDFRFRDLSSIYNSCRALIESALTINYLYYNPKSDEQATFRYLLYILSGLNNRQSFPAVSEEVKQKQVAEKSEIDNIIIEIKANSYFNSLHPSKQKDILGRLHAYEIGMKKIITESGLDNDIFHSMWRLFSNYSHSEYIEAMQTREYLKNPAEHSSTLFSTYRICFMITCYLITKMIKRFDLAKKVFEEQTLEIKTIVEFYNKLIIGLRLNR